MPSLPIPHSPKPITMINEELKRKIEEYAGSVFPLKGLTSEAARLNLILDLTKGAELAMEAEAANSAMPEADKKGYANAAMMESAKLFLAAMEIAGIPNFISGTVIEKGELYVLHFAKVSPHLQLTVTSSPKESNPPQP